jgi:hypothetical protein
VSLGTLGPAAARRLARRSPLPVRADRGFALKRNVQEWTVGAPAGAFARAFEAVMTEPGRAFGPIVLKRLPERVGRPFAAGERFHGCFTLSLAERPWLRAAARSRLAVAVEDAWLSDYAEVVLLALEPDADGIRRVVYRYLSGSPCAGATTLEITPLGPERCRFRALMAFQEAGLLSLPALHAFGLRAHDAVVGAQVGAAAARLGAEVRSSSCR